ncbi:MAG: thiamine phosphate synthase [Propionibacteriaceae bacterium]|jgi:thiamine-phosphate pyrophosphorylase|nr:thiamine phosphate synthase [Propionibacteriaceae bacterium]
MFSLPQRLASVRLMLTTTPELPASLPALVAAGARMVAVVDSDPPAEDFDQLLSGWRGQLPAGQVLIGSCERFSARADFLHQVCWDGPGEKPEFTLLGRTCDTRLAVDAALADPAVDYLCVGPAAQLDLVAYAAQVCSKVWFAAGGVNHENLADVLAAGAQRVCVNRAITLAADPVAATRELCDAVRAAARA